MLRIDEQFVYDKIMEAGGLPEIEKSAQAIINYRSTDFYESKNNLIAKWEIDHQNIYDLVISVFTACLANEILTYQTLVGMLNHKIKLDDELERVKILADLIGLISLTGLIDITSIKGQYHIIGTGYTVGGVLPEDDKHITITERPQPVESNWDEVSNTGSVILGHRMNHHTEYVRLSHLQRMGQIAFTIDQDFVDQYEEAPKKKPETEDQWYNWSCFKQESLNKYEELIGSGNKFYTRHKYCTRGRSYCGSYHINYQGSSFKKAAIQLFNKEIVEGV